MRKNTGYHIYAMWLDTNGWVVDGELGFKRYPGNWTQEVVREYYTNGWDVK